MRTERVIARRLRRGGRSYNEIARRLSVPKSTLATWFRDLPLPQVLREQLYSRARSAGTEALVRRNKRQTVLARRRAKITQQAARRDIDQITSRDLRVIGATLYWAEGVRRHPIRGGRRVAFSNADPEAIKVMMRFFREICGVPEQKFRAQIALAPGIAAKRAVAFWSEHTRIPERQFTKVYSRLSQASKRKRPRSRLPHGTVQLRIADTNLFYRIMGWIQGLQDRVSWNGVSGRHGSFLARLSG